MLCSNLIHVRIVIVTNDIELLPWLAIAGRPPRGALNTFSTPLPQTPPPTPPPPASENLKSGPAAAIASNSAAEDGVGMGLGGATAGAACPGGPLPGLGSLKLVKTAWGEALKSAWPRNPFPGI